MPLHVPPSRLVCGAGPLRKELSPAPVQHPDYQLYAGASIGQVKDTSPTLTDVGAFSFMQ